MCVCTCTATPLWATFLGSKFLRRTESRNTREFGAPKDNARCELTAGRWPAEAAHVAIHSKQRCHRSARQLGALLEGGEADATFAVT